MNLLELHPQVLRQLSPQLSVLHKRVHLCQVPGLPVMFRLHLCQVQCLPVMSRRGIIWCIRHAQYRLNDRLTTGIAIFSITNNSTPMPIDSISSDISIGVTDNIKDKIVKSEYIDIGSLLPNNIHIENSQKLTIYQGELVLLKTQSKVKIDDIDQWISAFIVFISIVCKVHVSGFQGLLKYLHTVRLGASRSTSLTWTLYDE